MVLSGLGVDPQTGAWNVMQAILEHDIEPWAPFRCPRCHRLDTIPMPVATFLDKLVQCVRFAPFKCRACRAKFYRHPDPVDPATAEPSDHPPADPRAKTLRRLDRIIRTAEERRRQ